MPPQGFVCITIKESVNQRLLKLAKKNGLTLQIFLEKISEGRTVQKS